MLLYYLWYLWLHLEEVIFLLVQFKKKGKMKTCYIVGCFFIGFCIHLWVMTFKCWWFIFHRILLVLWQYLLLLYLCCIFGVFRFGFASVWGLCPSAVCNLFALCFNEILLMIEKKDNTFLLHLTTSLNCLIFQVLLTVDSVNSYIAWDFSLAQGKMSMVSSSRL